MQSPTIAKLADALAKAQAAFRPAKKDSENPYFKSSYADLNSIWEAIRGPLTANGLSITQAVGMEVVGSEVVTTVETTLLHASGEWIGGKMPLKPIKPDPQAQGSAITYARRYALAALVGVVSGDDDDGNAASEPPLKYQAPARPAAPPAPVKPAPAKAPAGDPEAEKAKAAIHVICDIVATEMEARLSELEFAQAVTGGTLDSIEQIKEAAREELREKRGSALVCGWAKKADEIMKKYK